MMPNGIVKSLPQSSVENIQSSDWAMTVFPGENHSTKSWKFNEKFQEISWNLSWNFMIFLMKKFRQMFVRFHEISWEVDFMKVNETSWNFSWNFMKFHQLEFHEISVSTGLYSCDLWQKAPNAAAVGFIHAIVFTAHTAYQIKILSIRFHMM
jgi:hypothetical protein